VSARHPLRFRWLSFVLVLAACAGGLPARRFSPASAEDVRDALTAWNTAQERASSLAPSRLLYESHMGSSGLPAVPGTLAVAYDGRRVLAASLTGPFGSHVADYEDGTVKGQDRRAFLVDPDALRSVLAGVWTGTPSAVTGRDGTDCLLIWEEPYRVEAVLDLTESRLRSLLIRAPEGSLTASYSGLIDPWPQRVALKEAHTGRSLTLALLAVEPMAKGPVPGS
jgi:hypothetical protein